MPRPAKDGRLVSINFKRSVLERLDAFAEVMHQDRTKALETIIERYLNVAETDISLANAISNVAFDENPVLFVKVKNMLFDKNYLRKHGREKLPEDATEEDKLIHDFYAEVDAIIQEKEQSARKEIFDALGITEKDFKALSKKHAADPDAMLQYVNKK